MDIKLNKKEKLYLVTLGVLIFILPIIFTRDWGLLSFRETGNIGDTIGGITSPFTSLFGSLLVYLALKAQIDANKLVQDQFRKQEEDDLRKNFENTFFNMLNLHLKVVGSIELTTNLEKGRRSSLRPGNSTYVTNVFKGPDVFEKKYGLIDLHVKALLSEKIATLNNDLQLDLSTSNSEESNLNILYTKGIYPQVYNDFGNYFRSLYRLIKLVDEQEFFTRPLHNDLNYKEKMEIILRKEYNIKYYFTSIVRAYLSDFETKWLFFNCLSDYGREKFKPLIEKYSLLKIISKNEDVEIAPFKDMYKITAYLKSSEVN